MIFVNIHNGLGNQLFHYAAARNLAIRNKTQLVIDCACSSIRHEHFQLSFFNINSVIYPSILTKVLTKINKPTLFERWTFGYEKEFTFLGKNTFLIGNFQSETYFVENFETIKKELTPTKQAISLVEKFNQPLFNMIQQFNSVAVHVRRGDYVDLGYNLCSLEYYYRAIQEMKKNAKELKFFFFSDDIKWVKKHFYGDEFYYIDSSGYSDSSIVDFLLMMNCKHFIIANSSYSYWAAYLSDSRYKKVYHPKFWYKNNKYTARELELTPKSWIALEN